MVSLICLIGIFVTILQSPYCGAPSLQYAHKIYGKAKLQIVGYYPVHGIVITASRHSNIECMAFPDYAILFSTSFRTWIYWCFR